ncbi:4'-phosphopantetheinyl transferase family protein [Paenibacillus alvei]|uniref:4'-phosphopantetheinyl transferase family protein n=1 Tax=Paenibacillus alvei TaxID=44250 RepID=UPI0003862AA6|nr:4'-phosphopantetheinyl transferase superfamily protein [Paenibacillus alvei]EPY14016.1 phosphopantetheine-protein transferase [Paenibacillus alvei A6-6i-x]
MIDVYAVHINEEHTKALTFRLLKYVSQERRNKFSNSRHWLNAHRSILGEILVRVAVCNKLGISNHALIFGKNEYQKPLLLQPADYHFNITHSGEWVVCALSPDPVGIDVERIKRMNLDFDESIFSKKEYEALLECNEEERLEYFFKLWTLKESYVKAIGKGLHIPLNSFSFTIDEEHSVLFEADEGPSSVHFRQWSLDQAHIIATCSLSETDHPPQLRCMDYKELISLLTVFDDMNSSEC